MKRCFFVVSAILLFAACGQNNIPDQTNPPAPVTSPIVQPSPTPPPDFSHIDFTGIWKVTSVIKPDGDILSELEFVKLDTDFYLELIKDGVYFLYGQDGGLIGQGEYSVSYNILTLSANGVQTLYTVIDENTLNCLSADDSITIMTRQTISNDAEDNETDDQTPNEQEP